MKRFFLLCLAAMLLISCAVADPLSSYRAVQDVLLATAYKVQPFNAVLTGTISAIVPSYSFKNTYYLFVMVDPDDVSMWSTEDDNYFVALVRSDRDPFPFELGETITAEGQIAPIYSSPVCPYIIPEKINGSSDY